MSLSTIKQPLLKVVNLTWRVNHKTILDKISFEIHAGEIIGIIGPNGAGKTSLLRCLVNHQTDFVGDIFYQQQNIQTYSSKVIAKSFAIVAQKPSPIFSLTVIEVVRMGLLPHKAMFEFDTNADNHQIKQALKKVELIDAIDQPFNTLSGGEQQRVFIAQALVQKANILILDEPTNHLDVFYQHQILTLVKSLGITIIMTVHDLNLAAQYCQRLILLNHGELVADQSPDQLLTPEILSPVFRLPCHRDSNPVNNSPRITFYIPQKIESTSHE